MATVDLTRDTFDEIVGSAPIALVDFWARWCRPCVAFGPVYERAAQLNEDIVFGRVDTESEPDLAASFSIVSVPTLMVVRDRVVLYAKAGALPEQALGELILQARAVDMDDVQRAVAEQEATRGVVGES